MRTLAAVVSDPVARATSDALRRHSGVALAELSAVHGVSGSLALALEAAGMEIPEELQRSVEWARLVHLQTTRALGTVAGVFDSAGVRWAVLKGPALAMLWDHGTVTRTYDDLDLLVDPGDLPLAASELERVGFSHRNRNWAGFRELGVAEVPFDDGSVVIDLHWNVVALATQRRHLRFDTAAMLDRSVTSNLGGVEVRILHPLDMFAHTCTHAALAGARRLRMLRDVHLTASRVAPAGAAARVSESGVSRLSAGVLGRAVNVFGPAVEPGSQGRGLGSGSALGHRGWVGLSGFVDQAWSRLPGSRHLTYPGAVIAAGRDGTASTLAAMAGLLTATLRSRVGLPNIESEGGRLDWNVEDPPDAEAGYRRYLDYVAQVCA